jgi:NAD(P)-dependent dehydrogenase (short-subunit alcohol dehydrogenase family)
MSAENAARRAVVTGASQGLGAVLAGLLGREGYELILTARSAVALDAVSASLRGRSAVVAAVAGDVADPAHRARVAELVRRGGSLDLLVNNASELGPSPLPPLVELSAAALERIYRVNTLAPLAWVQELAEPLASAQGLVVNISSDAALGGYPGWGGYGSSKAALDLLSKTLAAELAPRGVAVVSVDPGDMRTAMHQAAFPGQDISDRPLPSVTVPFWEWLLHQPHAAISGGRFLAQADRWEAVR